MIDSAHPPSGQNDISITIKIETLGQCCPCFYCVRQNDISITIKIETRSPVILPSCFRSQNDISITIKIETMGTQKKCQRELCWVKMTFLLQ